MTDRQVFWDMMERAMDLANHHGLEAWSGGSWRFELPLVVWEAAKSFMDTDGYIPKDPPTRLGAYRLLGYPFIIDPSLPPDGLRLVREARPAV